MTSTFYQFTYDFERNLTNSYKSDLPLQNQTQEVESTQKNTYSRKNNFGKKAKSKCKICILVATPIDKPPCPNGTRGSSSFVHHSLELTFLPQFCDHPALVDFCKIDNVHFSKSNYTIGQLTRFHTKLAQILNHSGTP